MDLTVIGNMTIKAIEATQTFAALELTFVSDAECPFEMNSPEAHIFEHTAQELRAH